jgi:hypothetical protein
MSHRFGIIFVAVAAVFLVIVGFCFTIAAIALAFLAINGQHSSLPAYFPFPLVAAAFVMFWSAYQFITPSTKKPDPEEEQASRCVAYAYGTPISVLASAWAACFVLALTSMVVVEKAKLSFFNPKGGDSTASLLVIMFGVAIACLLVGLEATQIMRKRLKGRYPDLPLIWVNKSGISIDGRAWIAWSGVTQIDVIRNYGRGFTDSGIVIKSSDMSGLGRIKISWFNMATPPIEAARSLRNYAEAQGVRLASSVLDARDGPLGDNR